MKYNTAIKEEKKAAYSYFMTLANKKSLVEVKKISPNRTLRQNSYLHLLIGFYGLEAGYFPHEAKTVYKREANPDLYVYEKNGSKFLRSSADLDKEEMAKSIDRFMQFAGEQGIELPLATDKDWLRSIENMIETSYYA